MKFVTFQPLKVKSVLDKKEVYIAEENDTLNNKIFCLKLDSTTRERMFLTAPSCPQVMIIFETDKFEEIDTVSWVNKLFLNIETSSLSKYKEYTVDKIDASSVISMKIISTSYNINTIQNEFLDADLHELNELSGYDWFRAEDKGQWWSTEDAVEYVRVISSCMIPQMPLKEDTYDSAINLIRKEFRKRKYSVKK